MILDRQEQIALITQATRKKVLAGKEVNYIDIESIRLNLYCNWAFSHPQVDQAIVEMQKAGLIKGLTGWEL